MDLHVSFKNLSEQMDEFVERKGTGHPDTLSDALAEFLSVNYSNYTKDRFGAVLHHNFDKVGLLGGSSYVVFGEGYMVNPIRVLINGRASTKFGDEVIPIKDMLIEWSKEFLQKKFPMINVDKDLEFHYNLSNKSSPGKTDESKSEKGTRKYWFEPRDLNDLQETRRLVSNDTSLGVGYAPYTLLEQIVLEIERSLNSDKFRGSNPWIGSDIKVMGFRSKDSYSITLCIPQIASHVASVDEYKANLDFAKEHIRKIVESRGIKEFELNVNTRDNFETSELYLTATGSSIESGDEGLVGRGNRINGVISPVKPMSMEGACGKNPVYHIGKIYYLAAHVISQKVFETFGVANEVYIVSQSGRDLVDPWKVSVQIDDKAKDANISEIEEFVRTEVAKIPELTDDILKFKYELY